MQRSFAYSLKIGSSRLIITSAKLGVLVMPVAEIFSDFISTVRRQSLHEILADGLSLFFWQQIVLVFGAICATLSWELCHHLVQVSTVTFFRCILRITSSSSISRDDSHSDMDMLSAF